MMSRPWESQNMTKNPIIELDEWVSKHGTGRYIPFDYPLDSSKTNQLAENFGIQQNRDEIVEFTDLLQKIPVEGRKNALEVGLGKFGSTHFLWRHLYDVTATIEIDKERVLTFGDNLYKYYRKWVMDDGKSMFFFGKSSDPAVVERVYWTYEETRIDLLFIDGDHSYASVMTDYLLYEPLVNIGGIVAFHDSRQSTDYSGVSDFLADFNERLPFKKRDIIFDHIEHSRNVGIAYYFKR